MLFIESLGYVYDCPLTCHRQVDDSAAAPDQIVDPLKHGLLDDDLIQQLKNPSFRMMFA